MTLPPPDGFEQTRDPEPGDIPGVGGVVEAYPNLDLSAQMIQLVWSEVVDKDRDLRVRLT